MVNRLILWLICVISVVACSSAPSHTLNGSTWLLRSIDGNAVATEVNATIAFVDGQFSGNGGCNSYGGTYALDNTAITFTLGQMTTMACMGPGGDTEQQYLVILPQITTVSAHTDTQLTLGDPKIPPAWCLHHSPPKSTTTNQRPCGMDFHTGVAH
ncbi:MAG: META domain-containing protein [Roseiflexaceae bacterium]